MKAQSRAILWRRSADGVVMAMKLLGPVALSGLIAFSLATAAWSRAEVFSNYTVDQAKQQAQQDNKLLLIDFTATWCPPCKRMEASTWKDEAVKTWITENAIAVQVDMDVDRKAAAPFRITAIPTLVLFTPASGKNEFGRQDGYIGSSDLLRWLEGAKSGKSADSLEKEQATNNDNEIFARISKARQLGMSQQNGEALEEYIWLWNNIPKTSERFSDVRMKMVPVELKLLCGVYPEAKLKCAELRDTAEKGENRADWIVLSGVLDDSARTLAWFDKTKADPKNREFFAKNGEFLEPVLFANCRWADAANVLYPNPLAKINEYYKAAQDMMKPRADTEFAKNFDPFPPMVLLVYGAYVGAGRDAEAQKIADECIRLDSKPEMKETLDKMAKAMRQARATVGAKGAKPAQK